MKRRTVRACVPTASAMRVTAPAQRSIRCSPRSSATRLPRISRARSPAPRGRCPSSAWKASAPTSRSCTTCSNHDDFAAGRITTRWVDEHLAELAAPPTSVRQRFVAAEPEKPEPGPSGYAGARVDTSDPLALFDHDARVKAEAATVEAEPEPDFDVPEGTSGLGSPIQGTIVSLDVKQGDEVREGQQVAVVEAMKMEHVIAVRPRRHRARDHDGRRRRGARGLSDRVYRRGRSDRWCGANGRRTRPRLHPAGPSAELRSSRLHLRRKPSRGGRQALRDAAIACRARTSASSWTKSSFKEYWPLVVARQHRRYDMETLRKNTPTDGSDRRHRHRQRAIVRRGS